MHLRVCERPDSHSVLCICFRLLLMQRLLDFSEVLPRTSALARLYGCSLQAALTRGTQFRVECVLLRAAKKRQFVLVSPSKQQVSKNSLTSQSKCFRTLTRSLLFADCRLQRRQPTFAFLSSLNLSLDSTLLPSWFWTSSPSILQSSSPTTFATRRLLGTCRWEAGFSAKWKGFLWFLQS